MKDARSIDLVKLRRTLQRAIRSYTTAVLTMLDEDVPASLEVVKVALRPIDVARARLARSRSRSARETGEPLIDAEPGSQALETAAAQ